MNHYFRGVERDPELRDFEKILINDSEKHQNISR